MTAVLVGFGLGFLVAAQLGPISLLAIWSTLRNGVFVGLAIGGGVAVIDTLYAAAGAAGAAGLLAIEPLRLAGVGLGSLTWMTILAGGVSITRRWVGPWLLRTVDGVAGAGVLGFGALLAYRTLRD
jgi:hypothetical protein